MPYIYMICTKPRILIKQNSVAIDAQHITVTFQKMFEDRIDEVTITTDNTIVAVDCILKPPYNLIQFIKEDGSIVTDVKTSLLYPMLISTYDPILDLNVLYVGQAFGKKGERLASDRLMSHSTLQAIYSDAIAKYVNQEMWLILWQFQPYYISMMGSLLGKAKIGIDESINNFLNTVESTLPKDQQITITEAALIKYFQPKYNFEYKTNFPDKIHASYEVCYRLDLNSVAFELDTVSIVSRLHSASIEPSHIHLHQYFLHNEKERKDMFKMI